MTSTLIDHDAPTRPHLPIDPRIHQRLLDVRRQESRRRLRILAAVSLAIAVVAGAIGVLHTPLWKVRHVAVQGASAALPAATVRDRAGFGGEVLMVDVDAAAAARRLEALPLVATATVERAWPGTIRITVSTRTAVALAEAGGATVAVDRTGRVLAAGSGVRGLPTLLFRAGPVPVGAWLPSGAGPGAAALQATAPGRTAPVASLATPLPAELALAAVLGPALRSQVTTIGVTATGLEAWVGTTAVVFGDTSQLVAKATGLAAVLASGPLTGVTEIDVRVPDRPALVGGAPSGAGVVVQG